MTHREPDSGPCSVLRSRSKCLFAPGQHLDRDKGGFLVRELTSLSCLPLRHWEKSFTSQVRLVSSLNFRVPPRPVCQFTISRRNWALSPLTKLPSHFDGFPRQYVEKETFIKQLRYQPANCLSYQPDEFCVENNVFNSSGSCCLGVFETSACLVVVLRSLLCENGVGTDTEGFYIKCRFWFVSM